MNENVASGVYSGISAGVSLIFLLIYLAVIVLMIVAQWRMFDKAGEPGWACLIPFYNMYTMCKIGGVEPWLILLCFVPFANVVIMIMISYKTYTAYVSEGWAVLGIFFPVIVMPYIGFSDSVEYVGN